MENVGRKLKESMIEELLSSFSESDQFFITKFGGLGVANTQALRKKLREHDSRYKVVKHTLSKIVFEKLGITGFAEMMEGPAGVVYGGEDPAVISKMLVEFQKDNPSFEIKGGCVERRILTVADVDYLSKLPSKDMLRAQVVSGLVAPISGFVCSLQGVIKKFVMTLAEVADKKGQEG